MPLNCGSDLLFVDKCTPMWPWPSGAWLLGDGPLTLRKGTSHCGDRPWCLPRVQGWAGCACGCCSYLKIVRSSDRAFRTVDGNLQVTAANGGSGIRRWFYVTLQAGPTYDMYIQPGRTNSSFWPSRLLIAYADGWGGQEPCRSAPVSLRIMPGTGRKGSQWQVDLGPGVFWRYCTTACSGPTLLQSALLTF